MLWVWLGQIPSLFVFRRSAAALTHVGLLSLLIYTAKDGG